MLAFVSFSRTKGGLTLKGVLEEPRRMGESRKDGFWGKEKDLPDRWNLEM